MSILILGSNGQVGWELCSTLAPLSNLVRASRGGELGVAVDLADADVVRQLLDDVRPELIVNAAAYTAVDKAEQEPEQATLLNATLPGIIGQWAAPRQTPVVHYSTDYVYAGDKAEPYVETDPTNPVSAYGRGKLAGDRALLESGANAIVLRVSWVYGRRGSNFLLTMQQLMSRKRSLNIVNDQIGAPTWSRMVAEATSQVAGQIMRGRIQPEEARGIYHLAPQGEGSWFDFAHLIRDLSGLKCKLNPIPASEYPTPAARPANSRLDSGKLKRHFGISLPHWEESLRQCLST